MAKAAAKPTPIKTYQADAARQSFPYFQPLLQWYAQNAGLPQTPGIAGPVTPPSAQPSLPTANRFQQAAGFGARPQPMAPPMASVQPVGQGAPFMPQGPGPSNQSLGIFGQGADALRFQQAEEDVNEMRDRQSRALAFRLGQQGIGGSGTAASAQTQLARSAQDSLGDFRRNLAINAGQEQERRMQALLAAIGFGTGQGTAAQNLLMQQQQINAQKPSFIDQLGGLSGFFSPIKLR